MDLTSAIKDPSYAYFFWSLRCLSGTLEERKKCRSECTIQTCPLILSYWGYRPNVPINALFCGIFVVLMSIVLIQGVWTRRFKKYTAVMFIGCVMEIMGYVTRIYASAYPFSDISFITQLTTLTLAPAFYAAAIYFSLARLVLTFGAENSRISPRYIPRIFIGCDIVSLGLQGAGGAVAAYLVQSEKMPDAGNYTLIGGLSFQALTLLVFLILAIDFAIRSILRVRRYGDQALSEDLVSRRLRRSKRFRALIVSLTVSAILIFMRSLYRVAELSEGWKGDLMSNEVFVIWLEAVPVAISGTLLCVFHPANCFRDEHLVVQNAEMPETPPRNRGSDPSYEGEKLNYGAVVEMEFNERERQKRWR